MAGTKINGAALNDILYRQVGEWSTKGDLYVATSALEKLFALYSEVIEKELKAGVIKSGKVAIGNLRDNIVATPKKESESAVSLNLVLEDYYKYVNDGRTGKRKFPRDKNRLVGTPKTQAKVPPFQAISDWVRNKSIPELSYPKLGFKTRQTARVSGKVKKMRLVEKIRWGIYWNGIKPTYFYTDVINEDLIKSIEADIYELLGRTIELNISNVNNNK